MLLLFVIFFILNEHHAFANDIGVYEGRMALPFELQDIDGNRVKLTDFYGKKVIINFFATWCPPCQEEMPLLVQLHNELDSEKEILLAVNLTKEESRIEDVPLFMKQFNANFLVLYDVDGKVMNDYRIIGIPVTVFLNEKGKIVKRIDGALTKEILDEIRKTY